MSRLIFYAVGLALLIFVFWALIPRRQVTHLLKHGVVVISCWFGTATDIAAAPEAPGVRCIFFTNNPTLTSLISSRGWEVIVTKDPIHARDISPLDADRRKESLSANPGKSSLQSKQIKFLCLPDEHRYIIDTYKTIIYMDHKRIVDDIDNLLRLHTSDVLVRFDKKVKSIDREVQVANFQKRYNASMRGTLKWIEKELNVIGRKPSDIRICNTGVIVYRISDRVLKLCKEVYDTCVALGQPECQLIWATITARPDGPLIKMVEYKDVETRPYMW